MDFLDEKYAKGATGYDQRIRNTWPLYETIHPVMNAMLRDFVPSDGHVLIVGAGPWIDWVHTALVLERKFWTLGKQTGTGSF